MSQDFLGEFEQMILLCVLRLDGEAYGLAIRNELELVAGRRPSSGSLYTTLDRLEGKGLLTSEAGSADGSRGGRRRRYVKVTPEGRAQLQDARHRLLALWDGLETALDRGHQ
jgi:DNA-binding PadR family transcriptional regulator